MKSSCNGSIFCISTSRNKANQYQQQTIDKIQPAKPFGKKIDKNHNRKLTNNREPARQKKNQLPIKKNKI